MVIRSKDRTYEVIQRMPDMGLAHHYRCRCGESAKEVHLVQLPAGPRLIPRVLELGENAAFGDLSGYFADENRLTLVFFWPEGEPLRDCLNPQKLWDIKKRFETGRQILERVIVLQMPFWLYEDVMEENLIYPEQEPVGFYYSMQYAAQEDPAINDGGIQERVPFGRVFAALFVSELDSGRYPELEAFSRQMEAEPEAYQDIMKLYQTYLELLPVCMEERAETDKEPEPFLKRLIKHWKKIITVLKLLMGAAVLIAAAALLPSLWREKVEPVWAAAALWKAVYVDGETLAAETGLAETEAETNAPDPENGSVIWYWEEGAVCYKGTVADGMYEGKGTLYYPGGTVEYQGEFLFGKKEGEGSLYTEEGLLLYEGGFRKNKYEGSGRLYHEETGNLVYDGEFSGGKYDGEGILFEPWSEFPMYAGTFRLGFYDGKGVQYDTNGIPLYEGDFLLGVYHGHGTYYDVSNGLILVEGEFRNGNLIPPEPVATGSDALEWREGESYERAYDAPVVLEAG